MKICPCGIAASDCTYHAPVPETQRALDDGVDWSVPLSVYGPAGLFVLPPGAVYMPAPAQKPWKATPGADGSHVDDVLCKCGAYCIKHKSAYVDDQAVAHLELVCI